MITRTNILIYKYFQSIACSSIRLYGWKTPKQFKIERDLLDQKKYQPEDEIVILDNVLERKYPINEPNKDWADGKYPKFLLGEDDLKHAWQQVEPCPENSISMLTKVILLVDIDGLGAQNSVVEVHSSKFLRYLFPLEMAVLATPERIANLHKTVRKTLIGESYVTKMQLENMIVPIVINPDSKWVLQKRHIFVSLRYCDISVEHIDQIELPDDLEISWEKYPESFQFRLKINGIDEATITGYLHLYQVVDFSTYTHPPVKYKSELQLENWRKPLRDRPRPYRYE